MAVTYGVIGPCPDEVREALRILCKHLGLQPIAGPLEVGERWIARAAAVEDDDRR